MTLSSLILRYRAARGMNFDRVRMGNSDGYTCEVIDPPWWNLRRWWAFFFEKTGHVEFVLNDWTGKPRYYRRRVRPVFPPEPKSITANGRTIRPKRIADIHN